MTRSENGSEIFPVDSKGRVRVSRERREQLLDEFEKSGLSGAQFARTVGVKYQTFAFWRQQRQRSKPVPVGGSSPKKAATVEWLETVISEAQASAWPMEAALVVRLPSCSRLFCGRISAQLASHGFWPLTALMPQTVAELNSLC